MHNSGSNKDVCPFVVLFYGFSLTQAMKAKDVTFLDLADKIFHESVGA